MNEQTARFRLGIFVLASLILLAVLIILFGGSPTLFQPTEQYYLIIDDAAGINPGTPVRRSGVKIGEVENLSLDEQTGKVKVTIRIKQKYSIFEDDVPTIVQGLLGSDAYIDFKTPEPARTPEAPALPEAVPPAGPQQMPDGLPDLEEPQQAPPEPKEGPQAQRTPIPPGSTIQGVQRVDTRAVVQEAGKLVPPAERAMVDISRTLNRYEKMAPVIEDTLKAFSLLARTAEKTLPSIDKAGKEVQQLANDTRKTIPALRRTNDEIYELAKSLRAAVPDLRRTNDEYFNLAKETRAMMPQLRQTNDSIQIAARNWGKLGEQLNVFWQTNERNMSQTMTDLQSTVSGLAVLVGPENQKNIAAALANLKGGSEYFESIGRNTDALVKGALTVLPKINSTFTKADRVFDDLQRTTKPFGDRSERITTNMEEAAANFNATSKDMRELMRVLARGDGTIQRLLGDPSLYNNLDAAACGLAKMLPRLNHILHDVEIFADKIARHPEALGVRGAIAPSSGLKDLPPGPTIYVAPGH